MGYYLAPKSAAESKTGTMPIIGLVISATQWQLVVFPFVKGFDQCITENTDMLMLNPSLWSSLEIYCRSIPRCAINIQYLTQSDIVIKGITLENKKTYSNYVTSPSVEQEKKLNEERERAEEERKRAEATEKMAEVDKERKRMARLIDQLKGSRE